MHKIKLFIIGLILFFVSTAFLEEVSLYQITPCLLLPWVIYISVTLDYKYCLTMTFILSLALDIVNPQLLGFSTLLLLLVSHFTFVYHRSINKNRLVIVVLSLLFINLVYYLIQWIYFSFTYNEPFFLLGKIMLTVTYNTFLSFILVYLIALLDKLRLVIYD